jgi:methylthioribose-1-phosphate isomerase
MLNSLSLKYDGKILQVIDQQKLPHAEIWLNGTDPLKMFEYIRTLQVRGAPMIGVAAALSLACYAKTGVTAEPMIKMATHLREARPTAVNLMYAVDRVIGAAQANYSAKAVEDIAIEMFKTDEELCEKISLNGAALINDGEQILTHCNTGSLATAGLGTALGAIRKAHEQGKKIHVYVDETRPLMQGGRLTAWELSKLGIPYTLICDNMAGMLMAQGRVSKIFVGSDRIARNGDFANKIGTYSVAVLAQYHKIPFYVAAPFTTVDASTATGQDIPIEERNAKEVRGELAPQDAPVYNPAFDVTPAELVTGWVLDNGVFNKNQITQGEFLKK